jgi:hypothetical protein
MVACKAGSLSSAYPASLLFGFDLALHRADD